MKERTTDAACASSGTRSAADPSSVVALSSPSHAHSEKPPAQAKYTEVHRSTQRKQAEASAKRRRITPAARTKGSVNGPHGHCAITAASYHATTVLSNRQTVHGGPDAMTSRAMTVNTHRPTQRARDTHSWKIIRCSGRPLEFSGTAWMLPSHSPARSSVLSSCNNTSCCCHRAVSCVIRVTTGRQAHTVNHETRCEAHAHEPKQGELAHARRCSD